MIRKLFSLLCLLPVLLLTACAAKNLPFRQNPPPSLIVSITDPLNNDRYPVDGAIQVSANAVADEPITSMELWVDGELLETYQPTNQDLYYLAYTWDWSTANQGAHVFVVRALLASGVVAQSNIVNITASADPGFMLLYTTRAGETLDQIALDNGSSVEAILLANPGLNSTDPLPENLEIRVPVGISEDSIGPPPSSNVPPGGYSPVNFRFKRKIISPLNRSENATVTTNAIAQGCAAVLTITDPQNSAASYAIFRQSQGGIIFEEIASLPAGKTGQEKYVDDGLASGKYLYYTVPYAAALLAAQAGPPSNIVSVEITELQCASETLTVNSLFPGMSPTGQVYLYLSTNNKDWVRFPQGEFVFANPADALDLVQLANLADPGGEATLLRGEGWAWVGGELVFLGTFEQSLPTPTSPVSVGKSPSTLNAFLSTELEARGTGLVDSNGYNWVKVAGYSNYDAKTFRWGTSTGADKGIWQVSTYPFDKSPSLNPACLVLTGTVNAGTLLNKKEFQIDFSYLKPKPLTLATPKSEYIDIGKIYIPGLTTPSEPPFSPGAIFKNSNQPDGVYVKPLVNFDPCNSSTNPDGSKTYYIRVLPSKDGELLSNTSNLVVVTFAKAPPPVSINYAPTNTFYDVKILEFTEMHVPDYAYAYCIKIIENPYYKLTLDKWGKTAPGSTICPDGYHGEEDSGILDDIGDFIEDAVNFVSDLYNKLSDFVTELVDKLNPFCIQAKFIADTVGEGEKEVKDACHKMAVVAVAAAKTYVGLPPSLPNYDQLKSMGKDYMVELAAEELENTGIPCPQECKDLIAKGVDYSLEQLKSSSGSQACMSEQQAHELGFEPLCPPKGVVAIADYRGIPSPPLAVIEVTRHPGSDAANIPQPASCYATLNGTAANDSYVGKQMTLWFGQVYFTWPGTSLDAPLVVATAPIPSLASGESVKIPLVLKPVPYWLPGHYDWYGKWQNVADSDDWHMLYQGAKLTLTADGDCSFPGYYDSVTTSVEGETKYYGPLGKAYGQPCYPFCP